MNETEKENAKAATNKVAEGIADKAIANAKAATGWQKWLWIVAAIAASAVAYFTAGCTTTMSQAADGSWSYSGIIVLPVERGK